MGDLSPELQIFDLLKTGRGERKFHRPAGEQQFVFQPVSHLSNLCMWSVILCHSLGGKCSRELCVFSFECLYVRKDSCKMFGGLKNQ